MNELSTLAKFIYNTATSDLNTSQCVGNRFYSELIPSGESITLPALMFVTSPGMDTRGAFGIRLKTANVYQIKAVMEGSDFAPLEKLADYIDILFDWQNQIDPQAGRPRSQIVYIDPDNNAKRIMIMSMKRVGNLRYAGLVDAVNYCHLGGEYEIEYYVTDSLTQTIVTSNATLSQSQYLQQQINSLLSKESNLETMFGTYQPSTVEPIVPLTAAAVSPALPTVNTVYKVTPSANQVITLPASTGTDVRMTFDFQTLGGFTSAFALSVTLPDQWAGGPALQTTIASLITNNIASGAASISLRSIAAGVWSVE